MKLATALPYLRQQVIAVIVAGLYIYRFLPSVKSYVPHSSNALSSAASYGRENGKGCSLTRNQHFRRKK